MNKRTAKKRQAKAQAAQRKVNMNRKRSAQWSSAQTSRTIGMFNQVRDINQQITSNLSTTRQRARGLVIENEYAKRYVQHCVGSLVGERGIQFMSTPLNSRGEIDKSAARIIQDGMDEFSTELSVDGYYDLPAFQRQIVTFMERDGECFIRKFITEDGMKFGFVDPADVDHLKSTATQANGKRVINGVEVDMFNAPVAYHVSYLNEVQNQDEIIPADEMIHIFNKEYPTQTRGIPPLTPVIDTLQQLDKYTEAELVNKRVTASKMGVITRNELGDGIEYEGEETVEGIMQNVEPGSVEILPIGFDFQAFDPSDTTASYKEFTDQLLKTVASGLGVSHFSLTSDYGSVNYSSARFGSLIEDETWKAKLALITKALREMFTSWVKLDLIIYRRYINKLPATANMLEKANQHKWVAKQRKSVDPGKEAQGYATAIQAGMMSLTDALLEQGRNPDDHFNQLAADIARCESIGIDYVSQIMKVQAPAPQAEALKGKNDETK